jgi:uncharacterized membrane protein YphA (DoxX/SURF4 family)
METLERAKWAPVPLRLAMGIIFAAAGYMKLVGIVATIEYFAKHGFPVPVATAWFISLLELCGGIALILGLLVRYLGLISQSSSSSPRFGSSFLPRATLPHGSI